MSYEPTVWHTGDTVTAEKLNKLENQVEKVSKICNLTVVASIGEMHYFLMMCKENTEGEGPDLAELSDRAYSSYIMSYGVLGSTINLGVLNDVPSEFAGGKIYFAVEESMFDSLIKINGDVVTIDDFETSSYKDNGSWVSEYLYCYEITDDTIISIVESLEPLS